MKFLTSTFLIFGLISSSFAQTTVNGNVFILKGQLVGQNSGYVYLRYVDIGGVFHLDSCFLNNGAFEFRGDIKEPTIAGFYGNIKSGSIDDPNNTEIYLEPGFMQAAFEVDKFKRGIVSGSKTQEEFIVYQNRSDSLKDKWKTVLAALSEAREENNTTKVKTIYNEQMPAYYKETDHLIFDFIKQFPASFVSAYLLNYQTHQLTPDSLKLFYGLLSPPIQQSSFGKRIMDFITKEKKLEPGKQAPDFVQMDMHGRNISLSNFRGKYVLLDFWASWCGPCRAEHPYLKKAYAKYHKQFTIIGLSLDRLEDKNEWLDAIKKDELTWTQLCDFKGWSNEVVNQYNLFGKGIPANFLIDPQGHIVAKNLRGVEVEKKLDELLK